MPVHIQTYTDVPLGEPGKLSETKGMRTALRISEALKKDLSQVVGLIVFGSIARHPPFELI